MAAGSPRRTSCTRPVLVCANCGDSYPLEARFACDRCFGPVEPGYDNAAIRRDITREQIEQGPAHAVALRRPAARAAVAGALPVGCTPLIPVPRLAAALGLRELYIKVEGANPTHSFKDRVVSVASAKAVELGLTALACPSTGNLAGAVAAQAAALGLDAYIFVPADLEREKIIAASVPGATVFAVEGNYDDVNRLCAELAYERPWAFVNVNVRAYYAQGSKTLAFETAEQLGWRLPDQIVAPIASGSLFHKVHKGYAQLIDARPGRGRAAAGSTARRPRAARPSPRRGIAASTRCAPCGRDTIAKSLAIGAPADGANDITVAHLTGGAIAAVPDDEIVAAIGLLARTTGIFTETAGGVTVATLARLAREGRLDPDASTVAYITGDGLKTPDAALSHVNPISIEADIDAVDAILDPVGVR